MSKTREFDIVLLGATGFTGGLTAEYLAAHAPKGARWALAGRNRAKLEAVRWRLAAIDPALAGLELVQADSGDPESLRALAERARVVITTVGPYLKYGEPLLAACAAAGTDYVDLNGEPEFADLMYVRHHATAAASGARIVHACGFDSIPYDLGVYFTVAQLPKGRPIHVDGFIRASGLPSGGTVESALMFLSRGRETWAAAKRRRAAEPQPSGRTVRAPLGVPRFDRAARAWVAPILTIDPQVVAHSARLLDGYGPDFSYSHYAAVKRLPVLAAGAVGLGLLAGLAQVPPIRRRLSGLQQPGAGPGPERRARSWFTARFHGVAGDQEVVTEVSGGDPAYGETSKMLAESALCLAFDQVPDTAGCVTTAAAMGDELIARLKTAGIGFTVLPGTPADPPSQRTTPERTQR